jgi:lipoyl-dependent peroxiredoxin
MTKIEKILFTGHTHTVVNHESINQDGGHGEVDIKLSTPGGRNYEFIDVVPHPTAEQLFAGAWSACYITALGLAASLEKVKLPADTSVDIKIDVGQAGPGWFLGATFTVRIPGLSQEIAEALVHTAHGICPYSKAVKGNIEVAVGVVTK